MAGLLGSDFGDLARPSLAIPGMWLQSCRDQRAGVGLGAPLFSVGVVCMGLSGRDELCPGSDAYRSPKGGLNEREGDA